MRSFAVSSLALTVAAIGAVATAHRPPQAHACTGEPERFDELVLQADLIAVVRAETVGVPENSAPTVQPTFTPFPQGTPPPYPLGDFTGIGATVKVFSVIAGQEVEARLIADAARRAEMEAFERQMESVWPGTAGSNCGLLFQPRYKRDVQRIALYKTADGEFETTRLVKIVDDRLDPQELQIGPGRGVGLNLAVYERYFADIPAEITDYALPEGEHDHAYMRGPDIPLDRFVAFIQSVRGVPSRLALPDTGSAGLR